ncbi:MAG: DNA primase [Oscillospiraceae bacterium]|nr:DNA primase [Oscillospiraceae bacterium]
MALPESFLEQLKQVNDIVTAFTGFAELKRAGRDFVCLCPFHSEKSASCHIYTDSQSFYCFGCGAGGSIITFIQLTQNLDYISAVRFLAERSGISMPDDEGGQEALRQRKRIEAMNLEAAKFFRDYMISNEGNEGYLFMRRRGISDNTIRKYGLGYAPNSWKKLKTHMNSLNYSDVELIEASLLKQSESGSIYDMFRGRVMFPMIDRFGKILAFSGRKINDDDDTVGKGKYINSANTPIYQKKEHIFSINLAKNAKKNYMIICEGSIDAVMLNQAGFSNTVANWGTAFSPQQARLLKTYCKEVVLAYDSDVAGEKATTATINLFKNEGVSARVLRLEEANDPDEYINKFGADNFALLIEKSGSAISFELTKIKTAVNLETSEGRSEYLEKGTAYLAAIESEADRMAYGSDLAHDCGVTFDSVMGFINKKRRSREYVQKQNEKRNLIQHGTLNPQSSQFQQSKQLQHQAGNEYEYGNPPPESSESVVISEKVSVENLKIAVIRAEQGIIAYLFHSPDKLPTILRSLTPSDFCGEFERKLFETLILRLSKRQSIDTASLGSEFSVIESGKIEKVKIENAGIPFTDERLNDYIKVLLQHKQEKLQKSRDEMNNEEGLEYIQKLKEKFTIKL